MRCDVTLLRSYHIMICSVELGYLPLVESMQDFVEEGGIGGEEFSCFSTKNSPANTMSTRRRCWGARDLDRKLRRMPIHRSSKDECGEDGSGVRHVGDQSPGRHAHGRIGRTASRFAGAVLWCGPSRIHEYHLATCASGDAASARVARRASGACSDSCWSSRRAWHHQRRGRRGTPACATCCAAAGPGSCARQQQGLVSGRHTACRG